MRVFVLDNHDSFTWNLVQALLVLGAEVEVAANDGTTVAAIESGGFDALVISPGPGRPEKAGITEEAVRDLGPRLPILGVCLGLQAIGRVFGGRVVHAPRPVHGKTSRIEHDGRGVFHALPQPFDAMRYHSLCLDPVSLPRELEVTARSEDGVVMGIRHRALPLEGVQFHPESILTPCGDRVLANFLKGVRP